jgi:hypothetical protein
MRAAWYEKQGPQSYRPFGTAAELCVVPEAQVSELVVTMPSAT